MFKLTRKQLISSVIFSALLILLLFYSLFLRKSLITILKFPLKIVVFIQHEASGIIFFHRNLVQNESLKRENEFLRYKINSLNESYQENARLKNLLSFKNSSSFRLIASRVIARSSDSWSSGLIIDKGTQNGIRRGMSVITYLGLAGRVIEVASTTSKVMLLSDPNLGVSSIIQRSRQEGLVVGTLGGSLIMKYLPEYADIKVGDTVVTSGLNDTYPKGILVGEIIEVGKDFSGLSRYCLVKPAVNLSNLEEVLVVVQ